MKFLKFYGSLISVEKIEVIEKHQIGPAFYIMIRLSDNSFYNSPKYNDQVERDNELTDLIKRLKISVL
jgi:hypothetical protein